MAEPPPARPTLPVFAAQKWHKVYGGLHLTFLSLACTLLAFLPAAAAGVVAYSYPAAFDNAIYRYSFSPAWLACAGAIAIVGVCTVFTFVGQAMCCAAPFASGAKRWIFYSLFLFLLLVLPGAAVAIAGLGRPEAGSGGLLNLTSSQIRFNVSYPLLYLNIAATLAHILFVIGLLQINRVFEDRKAITYASVCLTADVIALAFDAVLFFFFVVQPTALFTHDRTRSGQEDYWMALVLLGIPALVALVIFLMFLLLVRITRNVVARGLAQRTGVNHALL
jgi:hypothetical protein